MKVAELKALLSGLPDDMDVGLACEDKLFYRSIFKLEPVRAVNAPDRLTEFTYAMDSPGVEARILSAD